MTCILIVDDNEANLKLHQDMLLTQSYEVIVTTDAMAAMGLAKTKQPNLILMDVKLSASVDGVDLTRLLKADPDTRSIPVVALTAMVTSEQREAFFQAGGNGYLTKPFTSEELLEKIRYTLTVQHSQALF